MAVASIRLSDEAVLSIWNDLPGKFQLPTGGWVHGAQVGWSDSVYALVDYVVVDSPPSALHEKTSETVDLTGNTMTVTYVYSVPTDNAANREIYNQLIDAEKRRRLRLGGGVPVSQGTLYVKLRTDFDFSVIVGLANNH